MTVIRAAYAAAAAWSAVSIKNEGEEGSGADAGKIDGSAGSQRCTPSPPHACMERRERN